MCFFLPKNQNLTFFLISASIWTRKFNFKRVFMVEYKELRRMKKVNLLEIMLQQAKRIEELEKENRKLNKELQNKKILLEDSSSLAEASLKLNDIFTKADESANLYIKNVKEKCDKEYKKATKETKKMMDATKKKCEELKTQTKEKCKQLLKETKNELKTGTKVKNEKVKTNVNKKKKATPKKK